MKKIISFAITLLFTTMASAQSFRIGPAARIQWSGTQAVNNKMGWAAGVQGDMTFGRKTRDCFLMLLSCSIRKDVKVFLSDIQTSILRFTINIIHTVSPSL